MFHHDALYKSTFYLLIYLLTYLGCHFFLLPGDPSPSGLSRGAL